MHALHGIGRATPRAFPAQRRGRSPRNAQSQRNPLFCGYDVTCAAPNPLIVQRRALCLCNADPCAFPMPGQFRSLCHGFTHWAHPIFFCHLQCQHNRAQSDNNIWFREFTRVKCGDLADRNHHANIHRAGGNWDYGFPLENTKSPPPRKSRKITQKARLGPPRDRPENYRRITKKLLKVQFLVIFR